MSENNKILEFKEFIQSNRDNIYSNTPKQTTISQDDEWFYEDEWDRLFIQTEEIKQN